MPLHEFISSHRDEIVIRWEKNITERLSVQLAESQLRNNLPEFLDDVARAMRAAGEGCRTAESARQHGRQRMQLGMNIGILTEEMTLVGETVAEVARDRGFEYTAADLLRMMSVIGQGAAASVGAYAELRDRQLANQAAQHFSFVAHEIRNPLHNAQLAAESLAHADDAERAAHLARLNRALAQLAELVDDSLVEARLYGEPQLRLRPLEVRELIESLLADVGQQAAERGLSLDRQIEDFTLFGDRTIVVSAVSNLLRNAVKFTREGGRVSVRALKTGDRATFEVADQCGGIPGHLLPRLFQRFVQGKPGGGGSGLGLVIAKQGAEAHGGAVRVENHPGSGCSFILELPLQPSPSSGLQTPEPSPE